MRPPHRPGTPARPRAGRSVPIDSPTIAHLPAGPRLGIWHLRVPAAPRPLVLRRDRPFDRGIRAADVADVMRYVSVARRSLKGPLALEIEGPGDPLASPDTVLRALALLSEHHPDVVSGLVVDGPLIEEYADELAAFGLRYLVVRMDGAQPGTVRRLVEGAHFRGELLDREETAAMVHERTVRALRLARARGIAAAVRTTLIPTVNGREILAIARRAREHGAERMDLVPHERVPGAALARAGVPTSNEMARARQVVARVFGDLSERTSTLAWLAPERMQAVDLDLLDAVDVLGVLPDPGFDLTPARVLPPRQAQIVAVATRDGMLVDTPLPSANVLRIYGVSDAAIRPLGTRPLPLDPRRRHDGVGNAAAFLEALVGCRALVATRIPKRAVTLLRAVGILPVAQGGPLEEVLDRVARGTLRQASEA